MSNVSTLDIQRLTAQIAASYVRHHKISSTDELETVLGRIITGLKSCKIKASQPDRSQASSAFAPPRHLPTTTAVGRA